MFEIRDSKYQLKKLPFKEKKQRLLNAIPSDVLIGGASLCTQIGLPAGSLSNAYMKRGRNRKNWAYALLSLIKSGAVERITSPTGCTFKYKLSNSTVHANKDSKTSLSPVVPEVKRGDEGLEDRLTKCVEELLIIAKEVSEKDIGKKYMELIEGKDAEILNLQTELESKKSRGGLLSFLK